MFVDAEVAVVCSGVRKHSAPGVTVCVCVCVCVCVSVSVCVCVCV